MIYHTQRSLFDPPGYGTEPDPVIAPAATVAPLFVPTAPAVVMRDYQEDAIRAIATATADGHRSQLIVMPTASGKTVVFSYLALSHLPGRTLILSHREELVTQAIKKIRSMSGGVPVGMVRADHHDVGAPIVSASVQSVVGRLSRFPRDWVTVIVDEAHHAVAPTYRKIIDALGAGTHGGPLLLGVTATADRGDGAGLGAVFGKMVYTVPLRLLVKRGYIANMRAKRVRAGIDFSKVKTSRGDYSANDLDRVMTAEDDDGHTAADIIAIAVGKVAHDRRILAFTPTVSTSKQLCSALIGQGFKTFHVDAHTPSGSEHNPEPGTRGWAVAALQSGELDAIVNCGVFTEGTDIPAVDCVVVARPTKSRILYAQMVGRSFRTFPGKRDALIIDLVGVTGQHKLITLPDLTGVAKMDNDDDIIVNADGTTDGGDEPTWSMLDDIISGDQMAGKAGRAAIEDVDIFASWANWIDNGNGRYVLVAGDESYLIRPTDGGTYDVLMRLKGDSRVHQVAEGLDIGYAQGVAEQRAASMARTLIDKNASWRSLPVSQRQAEVLELNYGIDPIDIMTMSRGQASDLMDRMKAARQWR